jgi:hypothetical protein
MQICIPQIRQKGYSELLGFENFKPIMS